MTFIESIESVFHQYFNFNGRAPRSEYWYFVLFYMLVTVAFSIIINGGMGIFAILQGIFYLAIFIPALAVAVRRLHDIDFSGWWLLIGLIPLFGALFLIFLFCKSGSEGDNRFGPNPLHQHPYLENKAQQNKTL